VKESDDLSPTTPKRQTDKRAEWVSKELSAKFMRIIAQMF